MADNEENQQPNEQAAAGEQAAGPQFALQRIYPVSYTHLTLPTICSV